MIHDEERLAEMGLGNLKQGKLPDIVAYSTKDKWIFLIEAYHTSNPITPERHYELRQMIGGNAKRTVFVTAFENERSYRRCPEELAWETEVWIATAPEHMIHRDGFRFLGPYVE